MVDASAIPFRPIALGPYEGDITSRDDGSWVIRAALPTLEELRAQLLQARGDNEKLARQVEEAAKAPPSAMIESAPDRSAEARQTSCIQARLASRFRNGNRSRPESFNRLMWSSTWAWSRMCASSSTGSA